MTVCTLRLAIGGGIAKLLIESEFGVWNEHAAEMHQALVTPEIRSPGGMGVTLTVRATPEAWDTMRRWCELRAVVPMNARAQQEKAVAPYAVAQRRIRKELDRLANHPGYRGLAAPGVSAVYLIGRRLDPEDRWWPTIRQAMDATDIRDGLETAELRPTEVFNRGIIFTRWVPHLV